MGVKTARYEFEKLFDEYEKLTSKEEFLKFKSQYADQLKFNEMDETDCSIDYPYETTYYASVMNNKGIFKVGLSLFKQTREGQVIVLDGNINKLENLNSYANDKTVLISTRLKNGGKETSDCLYNFQNWHYMSEFSDRRLINEIWVRKWVNWQGDSNGSVVKKGYMFYLHQASQKYSWLVGWRNYATTYVAINQKFKTGNNPTREYAGGISPEVKPDYDWNLAGNDITIVDYSGVGNLDYMAIPLFSFQADVSCRGFNGITYAISWETHSVFP